MYIEKVTMEIIENAIDPMISIQCRLIGIQGNEFLLGVQGLLYSESQQLLVALSYYPKKPMNRRRIEIDRYSNNSDKLDIELYGSISPKVASYLESSRDEERKGDVKLELKWTCEYLEHAIGGQKVLKAKDPNQNGLEYLCVRSDSQEVHGDRYLTVREHLAEKQFSNGTVKFTIPASDWLHDFKAKLGLGSYIGIEMPLPESSVGAQSEVLQKVYDFYAQIKESYIECRWGDVASGSRKLLEHLGSAPVFKQLCKSERYNQETFGELQRILDSGFQFASKFQHSTDKKKLPTDNPEVVTRTDAEFFLGVSSGIAALVFKTLDYQG